MDVSESARRGLWQIRDAIRRELEAAVHNGNRGSQLFDDIPAALEVLDRLLGANKGGDG